MAGREKSRPVFLCISPLNARKKPIDFYKGRYYSLTMKLFDS